ncbi:putative ATP-binding cassette transporter [Rhexocercosporidium sp. MPI-PUGE-AT-0058]|nr:putative ATP-binding cassette transporter [Rhexocercosporidium sp. MPI-PUGE-AT-0058]
MSCTPASDNVFGPVVQGCRDNFDFTLLFEQTILSISPATIFLLLMLTRLFHLYHVNNRALPSRLLACKLVLSTTVALCQLALLVLWVLDSETRTRASLASTAINLVVDLEVPFLSYLEHVRSIKPSSVLTVFLLLSILLDLPQARTLYLQHDKNAIAALFSAIIGLKLVLLLLEVQNKRSYLRNPYKSLGREPTSGILNRSFFWWINGLFVTGYRGLITFDDLESLDEKKPEGRLALPRAILRLLWWSLIMAIIPRLCLIGFNFAQPFLITAALSLVSEPVNPSTRNEGYGLIGATALIYLGIAITTLHYNHNMYRLITRFRGAMVVLIYNHTLGIQDGLYDESAAVTLMSTDVDNIANILVSLNECWAEVIEVTIGIYLLAQQVVSTFGASQITKRIGGRQKVWVDAVQRRIAITSSMLADMKSVKMLGLSNILATKIQSERINKTKRMAGFRWMTCYKNIISNLPYAWAPAFTFAIYAIQAKVQGTDSINTTQAFTSLSLITLVTNPSAKFLSAVPTIASSLGCFQRIQKFLLTDPRIDQRHTPLEHVKMASISAGVQPESGVELVRVNPKHSGSSDADAIAIENATIKASPTAEFAVRNVTINLRKSSITMIVGPVGCGKSTLLKALLGEVACISGSITITDTRIAYCAQTSWLPNGTVEQVICGYESKATADEKWYTHVVQACALDVDIAKLADGDQTIIGSGGATLSGGQKQRIALARAVYSRKDIVILDDVLSALDGKTQSIVVERLLGRQGLFRKLKTTVVLVTHATQYLPLADMTAVMNSKGDIVQQGDYNSEVHGDFGPPEFQEDKGSVDDELEIEEQNKQKKAKKLTVANQIDDLTRQTGDFTTYKYYFDTIGWPKSIVFVSFVVLNVFGATFSQIWLKWWTDISGGQIAKYISIYFLLAVFNSIGTGGYIWSILVDIAASTARIVHLKLLNTVMGAPQSFFAHTDSGSILNRFSQDMTLIESQLPTGVLSTDAVIDLFSCVAQAAMISTGSVYMAFTVPLLVLAIYALQNVYLKTSRQLRFLDLESRSPVYTHFLETLSGLSTIRAFGWQEASSKVNIIHLDSSQRPYYLLYCVQRWLVLVLDLIVAALALIVVALAVNLRESTSPGLLGVSLNNILAFTTSLSSLVTGWTLFETSLGAIARLSSFERDTKSERREGEDEKSPADWPHRGNIEFSDVTASYSNLVNALRNVSFQILPGQKIGICGRTGSGKSSPIGTILRLLELDKGSIIIDQVDLATLPRETIRTHLITIPQDPFLLSGSVRLNADPSAGASDSRIIDVLERVDLWGILYERGGLDADLHASALSRGQQQLFALARALLSKGKGKILILDEATSNVDKDTDMIMQEIIRDEFKGYTILSIAHRLSTIMDADKVLVIDSGCVVDFDSPRSLLDRGVI